MLNNVKSPDLQVYAVWVSVLPSDFELAVGRATNSLPDKRASHYWDGAGGLMNSYSRILQMGGNEKAWDVYFVYDRDAEWKEGEPPAPAYWMHQVDLAPERELDSGKLTAEINRVLEAKK